MPALPKVQRRDPYLLLDIVKASINFLRLNLTFSGVARKNDLPPSAGQGALLKRNRIAYLQ